MKRNGFQRFILWFILFLLAAAFVIKFSGMRLLRLYIESGIGSCEKIPVLCILPQEEIINPSINREYLVELIEYKFPGIQISLPKDFKVTKQQVTRAYYKKKKYKTEGKSIYLLHEPPGFFSALFPQAKKSGIEDNYHFISHVMKADMGRIESVNDAFFVVIKSIFIPDLGKQVNARIAGFRTGRLKGYIGFNIGNEENYFDCNVVSDDDEFYKIYIKDKGKTLDLEKIFTIISTIRENGDSYHLSGDIK